jgi:hypothetical protein
LKRLILFLSILALILAACGNDDNKADKAALEVQKAITIVENIELTAQVQAEKGVIDGKVYTQNGIAIGTLVLDKTVTDEQAKTLAQKYVSEIKKDYKDMKINVQAVRDGKNVVNLNE